MRWGLLLPNDIILARLVFRFPLRCAGGDTCGVERRRDPDDDICGEELRAVVCADGDLVFDFCFADFVDDGVDPEGEVDVFGCSVSNLVPGQL